MLTKTDRLIKSKKSDMIINLIAHLENELKRKDIIIEYLEYKLKKQTVDSN